MEYRITSQRIDQFEQHLIKEEKSAKTVEKYLRDVRAFFGYADGQLVKKELVMSYKQTLVDKKYAVRSINSMLASINSFLDFCGWIECKVKNIRMQRSVYCPEEKELTKDEYMRLLNASKQQPQLHLIMQTICATGIRISELKYFRIEAVKTGEVRVCCKGKNRVILIPGKLKRKLIEFAKKQGICTGEIFITRSGRSVDRSNVWAKMKQLCKAAGVRPQKVFPHNLRKLFARTFYGIEKDIAKLADILGHESIETTRIYIMTSGIEHRRKMELLGLVV